MVRLLQVQLFSLLFEAEQLELNDIVRLTRTVVQLNRQRRTKEAGPQQKPAASRPAATTGRNMFTEQDSQEIRVSPGKAFAPTITPAASGHPGRSAVPAGQSHQFRRTGKTRRACSAAGAPSVAGAARDEGSVTTY